VGIVGSLAWNRRHGYCYGLELIRAAHAVRRRDLKLLIVGDGDGRPRLERLAAALPAGRAVFTGRVRPDELPQYYAAMDVASLPQSTDGVGSYRYTTKLSEYLAFGLPIVTGQVPLAYDLDGGWLWRLPGSAPWDPIYIAAFARLLDELTPDAVAARRQAVPPRPREFDRDAQVDRVTAFLIDLLGAARTL
jgi:glycosyltransferase involved in cell wall biosynthesis